MILTPETARDTFRQWLFAGWLLLLAFPAGAQLKPARIRSHLYSIRQGLPSSEVYFVHQDREGYIWMATDHGVARFDGYRFKVYTTANGLVDNVVFTIYEDYKGRPWFLSSSGKLCYYEAGRMHRYAYNHLIEKLLAGKYFASKNMRLDRDGTLHMCVNARIFFTIDKQGRCTTSAKGTALREIEQTNGELYYRNLGGVLATRPRASYEEMPVTLIRNGRRKVVGKSPFSTDTRLCLYQGMIAGIERQMLFVIDGDSLRFLPAKGIAIGIYADGPDLWVGYYRGGVKKYRYDRQRHRLIELEQYFDPYSVSSICTDNEGGCWFSTLESGVFYVPSFHAKSLTVTEGLLYNNVNSLNGLKKNVFVGYNDHCLQQLNAPWLMHKGTFRMRLVVGALGNKIYIPRTSPSVLHPSARKLYRETTLKGYPYLRFLDEFHAFQRRKNTAIVVRYGEIVEIDQSGRKRQLADLYVTGNHIRVRDAIVDERGMLYLATNFGLYQCTDDIFVPLFMVEPRFKGAITDLDYNDQFKGIAATSGNGLIFFRNNRVYATLTTKDGLLSNQVSCVYIDSQNRLWVGTSKGLNLVRYHNGRFTVEQLTTMNGLSSNEVNAVYEYGNTLWVATHKGVSIIDLDRKKPASGKSLLYLNTISTIDNRQQNGNYQLFPAGTPVIKVSFRTMNFKAALYHRFRYRLNASSPWLYSYEPEIVLNAPKSGDYALEVSYRNEDGNWVAPALICSFTVDDPLWAKWYSFLAYGLLLAGGMVLVFRYRIRQIRKRHQYESTINQLEQKALSAQMNPHFIFNSLNSIQSFLLYEENEKAERYLLKFSSLIRQTLANSREHYIRLEQELMILQNYLELEQMRFKDRFAFRITSTLPANELQYYIPPMLIQPYVENAVIHGVGGMESGGLIEVQFTRTADLTLHVIIDDNGLGRRDKQQPETKKHRSYGTRITQERLEILKKQSGVEFTVSVTDKVLNGKPVGTKIALTIPLKTDYVSQED